MVQHPFSPTRHDKHSKILILGSFPSIKSREIGFYYQHPQNRFWHLLATLFDTTIPTTKSMLGKSLQQNTTKHSCVYGQSSGKQITQSLANVANESDYVLESIIQVQCDFLLSHHIVLWDIVESCNIHGSSDMSMNAIQPNDITKLLSNAPSISLILLNGTQAAKIFCKFYGYEYCRNSPFPKPLTSKVKHSSHFPFYFEGSILLMPSTSPANASFGMEKLKENWKILLDL